MKNIDFLPNDIPLRLAYIATEFTPNEWYATWGLASVIGNDLSKNCKEVEVRDHQP